MTQDRTTTHRGLQTQADRDDEARDDGPSPLLQQAEAYAGVAREAMEDCERDADAEREMERRRNRSGQ